jgi:hypothetical protein
MARMFLHAMMGFDGKKFNPFIFCLEIVLLSVLLNQQQA